MGRLINSALADQRASRAGRVGVGVIGRSLYASISQESLGVGNQSTATVEASVFLIRLIGRIGRR